MGLPLLGVVDSSYREEGRAAVAIDPQGLERRFAEVLDRSMEATSRRIHLELAEQPDLLAEGLSGVAAAKPSECGCDHRCPAACLPCTPTLPLACGSTPKPSLENVGNSHR